MARVTGPLTNADGRVVPVLIRCSYPGCAVGQYLYPGDQGEHQAAAGHPPQGSVALCPVAAVGT
jgi:hypothetical protein